MNYEDGIFFFIIRYIDHFYAFEFNLGEFGNKNDQTNK